MISIFKTGNYIRVGTGFSRFERQECVGDLGDYSIKGGDLPYLLKF